MVFGLIQAGAKVVATASSSPGELESVAQEVGLDRLLPVVSDVTSADACEHVAQAALRRFGALHILVNNAGRGMRYVTQRFLDQPIPFWDVDPDVWRMIIDTNVNGPFLMARAVLPAMLSQRWGRIINISMNHSTMRRRGFAPYGHSKAALESETVIWAHDLENTGVTVNALLPGGATATGMIPEDVSPEIKDSLLRPEIMVSPLLWLASEAADGVNGCRVNASHWDGNRDLRANVENAVEMAGWGMPS